MRLNVHRYGTDSGPPVVCLHGVMGNGTRFRRLAGAALAGRRVLAPDLRGHGQSGWEPPWNIETHLEDIRETLDAEGVDSADVVGFSFGGRLALELAAADRHRVRRLVLLDPAVQLAPEVAFELAEGSRTELAFGDEDEAVDARLAALEHAPREWVAQDLHGTLATGEDGRLRYRVAPSAIVAAYGEMARAPSLPTDHPTLLVRAAGGIVDDRQEGLLRATLPALRTILVEGMHSVMWDAFDTTAEAVRAHLAG